MSDSAPQITDINSERQWHALSAHLSRKHQHKLCLSTLTTALSLSTDPAHQRQYHKLLKKTSLHASPGAPYTTAEKSQLETLTRHNPALWGPLTAAVSELPLHPHPTEPRRELWVPTAPHAWEKLPRFFSWLVPGVLAGMSTPKSARDIKLLEKLGITHVITLTEEEPLPRPWFSVVAGRNIRNTFVPTRNFYSPTSTQMDFVIRGICEDAKAGGRTLVHCGGGKGRAGTVLACYVALYGTAAEVAGAAPAMSAAEAVEVVRRLRPGSLETAQQEEFVRSYVRLAWKRVGRGERLCGAEPAEAAGDLEIEGETEGVDVLILVGTPGSGKSAFTRMVRVRAGEVTVVSSDAVAAEGGDVLAACERALGRWRKSPSSTAPPNRKLLILDRCNPTVAERKQLLRLLQGSMKIFAVHFEVPPDICIARAETRAGHPTLPPWRARTAVTSTHASLVPPTMAEGLYCGIATVRSFPNARALADSLFGGVQLAKFPRTQHLLNLGSATRDDLILAPSDAAARLSSPLPVTITEKIDGANLGFSLSPTHEMLVQNRSHYICGGDHAQFSVLPAWLAENAGKVYEVLMRHGDAAVPERFVLYGEWMVATHSVVYHRLRDWFVAFEMWDRLEKRWLTRGQLENALCGTGLELVHKVWEGVLDGEGEGVLRGLLKRKSMYGEERIEGVVVKWETGERGKVVRGDFLSGDEHWSRGAMRRNMLRRAKAGEGEGSA